MKKWLVLLIAFMLLFVYVSSNLVVAEENDNDSDENETDDDSNLTDDDSDEDEDDSEDECEIEWECGDWGACIDGEQIRTCVDENSCNVTESKPAEVRGCNDSGNETDSDDDGVDDDTEDEIDEFDHDLGVEMRFLQLEFSIKRRILWMNAVVDRLESNVTNSTNTTELKSIIAEMELLADEAENVDLTKPKDELTQQYIDIKKDAHDLVGEFRTTVREMLTDDMKNALRLRFEEIDRENLKEIREQIKEKRRLYNEDKTRSVLEKFGDVDEELLRKVKEGELKADEVKEELRKKLREKSEEQRLEIKTRLDEEKQRIRADIESRIEAYKREQIQRTEDRIKERIDALKRTGVRR